MPARPSAKALITTGLCLIGGAIVLQILFLVVQSVGFGAYYGGFGFGWSALSILGTLVSIAGATGGAILAGGLVVKALGPQVGSQPGQQYGPGSGYSQGAPGQYGAGQYGAAPGQQGAYPGAPGVVPGGSYGPGQSEPSWQHPGHPQQPGQPQQPDPGPQAHG